jgi:hypothetical protein
LGEGRGDAGQEIEDQEVDVAELVLDIVAEDPQEQHVAEEMKPASVHEHGGEDGHGALDWILREARRDERPLLDEAIAAAELDQKEQHVEADQGKGDDWCRAPLRVVVADGEHLPFVPRSEAKVIDHSNGHR